MFFYDIESMPTSASLWTLMKLLLKKNKTTKAVEKWTIMWMDLNIITVL